jgi:hypothetical protein
MSCQMMRVISSPSISTTGFFTAIFAIAAFAFVFARAERGGGERNALGQAPYGAPRRVLQE